MQIELEQLLARREAIADEITAVIGKLGVLVREEQELQDHLRRAAERDGSRTNAFATALTVSDAVCGELTAAGLVPRRGDPAVHLAPLIEGQHRKYRDQRAVRKQVAGRSVA
jgi:hypothetical protein